MYENLFLTILLLISISNSKDLLMLPHYEKKSYMDNSVQEFLERKGCATVEKKRIVIYWVEELQVNLS